MAKLKSLYAREVLDSRGNPTIEVVAYSDRFSASAIVPSGASTGSHEAVELRDKNPRRYFGKGVLKAVHNVNSIINKKLAGADLRNQRKIDEMLIALDGTKNKSRLGANAILGVSLACAKLAALEKGMRFFEYIGAIFGDGAIFLPRQKNRPKKNHHASTRTSLPVPLMNILNGGIHADSGLEFQELMIIPHTRLFREALRMGSEIFHTLKKILADKKLSTTVGDEGGFAPRLPSHEIALDLIMAAIAKAGYKAGKDVSLALDAASTEFFKNGVYYLTVRGKRKKVKSAELIDYYEWLVSRYPIISIEDGCAEDDWEGWKKLTDCLGKKIQLVGDDVFVTDPQRLDRGIRTGTANAILIKLNQIGTLTETLDVIAKAKAAKYETIISHRSGETEDTTIAHLAVGVAAGQIKTGSLCRSERIAKYNELLRIEELIL